MSACSGHADHPADELSLVTPHGHTTELDHDVPFTVLAPGGSRWSGDMEISATSEATSPGFQLEIRFPDATLTPAQQAVFTAAAERWEQVLTGDLPDVNTDIGLVDDLVIDATGPFIDGPGAVLGSAGPTALRSSGQTGLPARGQMRFDSADIAAMEANGTFEDVIVHEMGHVLGVGTLWGSKGLRSGSSDLRYEGTHGNAQYQAVFGLPAGSKAPVETTGGSGTAGGHWREGTSLAPAFDNELMTGFLDSGVVNPVSLVTVAQFADLGYPGVNLNAFDLYTPPAGGNAYPTVASLGGPGTASTGSSSSFTLTANGAADANGSVASVKFYRESNGLPGLQVFVNAAGDLAADTLVATDASAAGGFTASVSAAGLSAGAYTFYAQATDNLNLIGVSVGTTVTLQDAPALPAWLAPGSAATWNAATKALGVTGAATIVADPGADSPVITANGAAAVLTINPAGATTRVNVAALTLTGGATAALTDAAAERVLVVQSGGVNISGTGSALNLADNALVVKAGPLAGVRALITTGFAGGAWTGPGIRSTAAAADTTTALGYASAGQLGVSSFLGVTGLAGGDVVVRHTYFGDTNLDRLVNTDDIINILAAGKLDTGSPATWFEGDMTFDGLATTDDIIQILSTGRLE